MEHLCDRPDQPAGDTGVLELLYPYVSIAPKQGLLEDRQKFYAMLGSERIRAKTRISREFF